jgi:hypothetical protein
MFILCYSVRPLTDTSVHRRKQRREDAEKAKECSVPDSMSLACALLCVFVRQLIGKGLKPLAWLSG